jgi:hypothetical protein
MENEGEAVDPEVKKLVQQTIFFLLFVARWLARRFHLEQYIKT